MGTNILIPGLTVGEHSGCQRISCKRSARWNRSNSLKQCMTTFLVSLLTRKMLGSGYGHMLNVRDIHDRKVSPGVGFFFVFKIIKLISFGNGIKVKTRHIFIMLEQKKELTHLNVMGMIQPVPLVGNDFFSFSILEISGSGNH